jgi:tetratricopeptide (TPR) repeat protein
MRQAIAGPTAALAIALSLGVSSAAKADAPTSNQSMAEVLFDEARNLLAAGRYAEACQKFAESQRLDPGGGTILNLALCYEKQGRIATAWATFREALGTARRDRRAERERLALEHLGALEPRLPRLTVSVSSAAGARVEVTLDGTAVNSSAWGTPIPVDPGAHAIEATAPEKKKWTSKVSLRERELIAVVVPALENDVGRAAPGQASLPTKETNGRPTAAYVAGGVALAALGVGAYYGMAAIDERRQADPDCGPDFCKTAAAASHNDAAVANAWISDAAFGVGLVAAGLSVYWFLSSRDSAPTAVGSSRLGFAPLRDGSGGVGSWQGTW